MMDEQLAREIAEKWIGPESYAPPMASGAAYSTPPVTATFTIKPRAQIVEELAALITTALARRALEEAKWWKLQLESRIQGINFYQHMNFDVADKIELERIAALEQAAASKAAGGSHD